jgi:hypothetical protein
VARIVGEVGAVTPVVQVLHGFPVQLATWREAAAAAAVVVFIGQIYFSVK